jgi:thymidylate kinase
MIYELIGLPGSGKSTILEKIKNIENESFSFQDNIDLKNIKNLKYTLLFVDVTFNILFKSNLSMKSKRFYIFHLFRKIIYIREFKNKQKIFFPDEGLLSIYISLLSIFNVSIHKFIEKYIPDEYAVIYLKVENSIARERFYERGLPDSWVRNGVIRINSDGKFDKSKTSQILNAYVLNINNLMSKDIKLEKFEVLDSSDVNNTTNKILEIISNNYDSSK